MSVLDPAEIIAVPPLTEGAEKISSNNRWFYFHEPFATLLKEEVDPLTEDPRGPLELVKKHRSTQPSMDAIIQEPLSSGYELSCSELVRLAQIGVIQTGGELYFAYSIIARKKWILYATWVRGNSRFEFFAWPQDAVTWRGGDYLFTRDKERDGENSVSEGKAANAVLSAPLTRRSTRGNIQFR